MEVQRSGLLRVSSSLVLIPSAVRSRLGLFSLIVFLALEARLLLWGFITVSVPHNVMVDYITMIPAIVSSLFP